MARERTELLPGTLDLLILRTLQLEAQHGYGIALRLEQITHGAFRVNAGSLFPALYRMEREGYVQAAWKRTENGRRAKYYGLTAAGRKKLAADMRNWERVKLAIGRVLEASA